MDKSPPVIGRMFDRIARHYDNVNTILSLSIDRSWRETAVKALGILPGDAVLDIATGTGDMTILALEQGSCRVVGIDLSRQMLVRAIAKTGGNHNGSRFRALQGDALVMPFRDGSFHKSMTAFGIRNVQDIAGFLKEVHRVLKIGGLFSVLEFSMPRFPPFRWIYSAYLNWLLPFFGGMISRDFASYWYLRDSIKAFPAPDMLERVMEETGFNVIQSRPLFQGILHLYLLEKKS
jgi:demethylmenaquinone methyltransferase/2-methoxy-6-polyprenyl-1,4-benzoquinol methylase